MLSLKLNKATVFAFLAGCLFGIIGFALCRSATDKKEITKLVKGDTLTGSVSNNQLAPVKEERPDDVRLPMKPDTVYIDNSRYIYQKVDTQAIISDYITKRSYSITAFDNKELGKLNLYPTVQYN